MMYAVAIHKLMIPSAVSSFLLVIEYFLVSQTERKNMVGPGGPVTHTRVIGLESV